jgi:endonuclease VIII
VPEGDTIHRTAARLRPALVGRALTRFEAARVPRPHPRPGSTIESVRAQGKHLMVAFSDGRVLQTHLGMTGSWHLYATGQRWRKPRHLARVVLVVDGWEAVCFSAPTVRLGARVANEHLGPDLCLPEADLDECVRRMGVLIEAHTEIADVLLDQRVCCGVGNVYKSEVCHVLGLHPLTPIGRVDDVTRRRVVATAARLMRANLGPGPRTTVGGAPGSLAVYGRARRPCRRCGTPVVVKRTGRHNRSTYWCPHCQPMPDDALTDSSHRA